MKNVLLPTDLTVHSLSPIHEIVRDAKNEKVVIQLVHMLSLPTSIIDLLFIKENKPYNKVPQTFVEGFQMFRNKYKESVEDITFDFLYCSNSVYLNNFIKSNRIEAIYLLDNYDYKQPLQQSEDFTAFIEECETSLIKLPVQPEELSENQIVSSLLKNNDKQPVTSTEGKTAISTLKLL